MVVMWILVMHDDVDECVCATFVCFIVRVSAVYVVCVFVDSCMYICVVCMCGVCLLYCMYVFSLCL